MTADGGLGLRLAFEGPLEWETLLSYFAARAIPGVEHVSAGGYIRTVVIDGHPGVLELTRGGEDHLVLRAHPAPWEGLSDIASRARGIFSLDAPVADAVAFLSRDPIIGRLVRARPGLRVPGTWDPFETAIRAIIGQQISVAGASTITGRLAQRHGSRASELEPLGVTHIFPPPVVLASADLSGLGLTGARATAIRAFAAAVSDGEVSLDRSVPLDRLVESITAIPGLGPWSAHYIALRLGAHDAFPAEDVGLRRAVRALGADQTPAQLAEQWSPWRATAAVHLWTYARRQCSEQK